LAGELTWMATGDEEKLKLIKILEKKLYLNLL
jgi:hypothetical protein